MFAHDISPCFCAIRVHRSRRYAACRNPRTGFWPQSSVGGGAIQISCFWFWCPPPSGPTLSFPQCIRQKIRSQKKRPPGDLSRNLRNARDRSHTSQDETHSSFEAWSTGLGPPGMMMPDLPFKNDDFVLLVNRSTIILQQHRLALFVPLTDNRFGP
jgi:hypothetical protein